MQRGSTTVVTLVGANRTAALLTLERAANVRVLHLDESVPALERAVAATSTAASAHVPYLAHDADPLAVVADAWVRYFDGTGPIGELEVAVSETLARARAGSVELPDYYLVLDPERLEVTRRHFWLGLVHRRAPARVIPVERPPSVVDVLAHLPPGRWWPPLDEVLRDIERQVPDHVSRPSSESAPPCR